MHTQSTIAETQARKRLAVVGRVSTLEQERYGTSLEDQAHKGDLLAQLHGMDVVPSDAYQGDESGALPLQARPIMQRLIVDARAQRFDAVCFHKIDRIARRLKYILEIWDELTDAGVTVYIIDPAIDTSTIMGRLLRNVLGTIAEFERDMILERTQGGRAREIAGGAVYAPRGKYGYEYQKRDRTAGAVPAVRPHPEHGKVVQRMYALRARKWSCERIATLLTAEGEPPPSVALGHKHRATCWDQRTVYNIVTDRSYMGEGTYGRTTHRHLPDGRRQRLRIAPDRQAQPVVYPPLVTPDEWHAANVFGSAGRACAVRAGADEYLLYGGMVRCAEHDRAMGGSRERGGRRRYRCSRTLHPSGRTSHGVTASLLDEAVWQTVSAAILEPDLMLEAAARLARDAESGMEAVATRKREIALRLATLEEQMNWIMSTLREAGATAAEVAGQTRLVREEQSRLQAELAPLCARMALLAADLPRAEHVRSLCQRFAARAHGATATTKRALLEDLEVSVVLEGTRYAIEGVLSPLRLGGELPAQVGTSAARSPAVRGLPFVLRGDLAASA